MTISNQSGQDEILLPAISVDQTQSLLEIYEENYPPTSPECEDVDDTCYEGRESFNKKIRIHGNGDITNLKVDAIVNAVQTDLSKPAVGLCRQMFYKGGPLLKQACLEQRTCAAGEAFLTEGYELPARYVIHTAGPSPNCRLKYSERLEYLRQSYLSCLSIAKTHNFSSVGIPCLGTGGGGISLNDGVKIAITAVREWLEAGNQIDHIVFCLYDDKQYGAVIKEMVRCFPSGKDAAGIDLEQLATVSGTALNPPAWIQKTNILCLKYSNAAKSQIKHHFHSIVNNCHQQLSPLDSDFSRYRDCAMFNLTSDKIYRCIILHCVSLCAIEIQILKRCRDIAAQMELYKVRLTSVLKDYLEVYLENVTPFDVYIRCEKSTWKSKSGLWPLTSLQTMSAQEVPCDHGNNMVDMHVINPQVLMMQWPSFRIVSGQREQVLGAEGGCSRAVENSYQTISSDLHSRSFINEPVEHLESDSSLDSASKSTVSSLFSSKEPTSASKNSTITCKASALSAKDTSSFVLPSNTNEFVSLTDSLLPSNTECKSLTDRVLPRNHECEALTGNLLPTNTDFVPFENACSLTEECVRPKVYNSSAHLDHNQDRYKMAGNDSSSRKSNSVSVKFSSLFRSLFSSNTDNKKQNEIIRCDDNDKTELKLNAPESQLHAAPTFYTHARKTPDSEFHEPFNYFNDGVKNGKSGLYAASDKIKSTSHDICILERSKNKDSSISRSSRTGVENSLRIDYHTIEESIMEEFKKPSCDNLNDQLILTEKSEHTVTQEKAKSGSKTIGLTSRSLHSSDSEPFPQYPSDKDLLDIAEELGCKHEELGIRLGLKLSVIQRIRGTYPNDLKMQGFHVLNSWFVRQRKGASLEKLFNEMDDCDIDTLELRQKFKLV